MMAHKWMYIFNVSVKKLGFLTDADLIPTFLGALWCLYEHDCKAAGENLTNLPSLWLYYIIKHASLLRMAAEMEQRTPLSLSLCTGLNSYSYLIYHVSPISPLIWSALFKFDCTCGLVRISVDRPRQMDHGHTPECRGFFILAGKCRNVTGASRGRPEQGSFI